MKKYVLIITALFALTAGLFAQETETPEEQNVPSVNKYTIDGAPFRFVFEEGVSYAQVTRVEKQTGRSNFVRENMMAGAYFNFHTVNLSRIDFTQQISAYYPFYNAFNGMRQYSKNILNYAVDSFTGVTKTYERFPGVKFNGAMGLHYMFQLTDEWPMHYIGFGVQGGFLLPISKNFSIVNNYFISFDNANIGPNSLMQPFTISYQYHADLGVRFSKRTPNSYCYIKPKSL